MNIPFFGGNFGGSFGGTTGAFFSGKGGGPFLIEDSCSDIPFFFFFCK